MKILAMKCVNCGGALEIPPDMEHFTCGYCGTPQVVQRFGGAVVLKAVAEAVAKVQAGTDRTAAELALTRLKRELEELEEKLSEPFVSLPEAETQAALGKHPKTAGQTLAGVIFVLAALWMVFLLVALFRGQIDYMGRFIIHLVVTAVVLLISGGIAFGPQLAELSDATERQKQALATERNRVLREIEENYAKVGRAGERAG